MQVVFGILDLFSRDVTSLSYRDRQALKDLSPLTSLDEKVINELSGYHEALLVVQAKRQFLDQFDLRVLAAAAFACKAFPRSIRYLEQHLRMKRSEAKNKQPVLKPVTFLSSCQRFSSFIVLFFFRSLPKNPLQRRELKLAPVSALHMLIRLDSIHQIFSSSRCSFLLSFSQSPTIGNFIHFCFGCFSLPGAPCWR